MKTKLIRLEKMLILSIGFTLFLLALRIVHTGERDYAFYIWNIFLAVMPILFSRKLLREPIIRKRSVLLIVGWLLFFPNAPYLVTDLFHFSIRDGAPAWYDVMLVMSAAWNGLALGIISLMQVEQFLENHLSAKWLAFSSGLFIILCGYGIYLGRILRFNSWDILFSPASLFLSILHSVMHPRQDFHAWAFTIIFSGMFGMIYATVKLMRA